MYKPMKLKPIKIKPINFHLNLDTDRDKVLDWKDCQPFNPHKQGWWHDIKKKVSGGPGEAQQLQKDIEDFKYNEKTGEYELRNKKKKLGEEGYIKEGAEELTTDIKKYGKKAGEYIAEKVGQGADVTVKAGKRMKDMGEVLTEQGGFRQARSNVREGLKTKQPISSMFPKKRSSSRPPPSTGWWGSPSYQEPRIPRLPSSTVETESDEIEIPEEYKEKLGIEAEEYSSVKVPYDMKRSSHYQEQSSFGRGVVPYRPVSAKQAILKVPPVKAMPTKRNQITRPKGLMPMATINFKSPRFMYFGRRVRR